MLQPPIQCCSPQHLRLQRAASGFTRLMIEKPFGRDSPTFNVLNALTSNHFKESQLFRLDHYLGKEVLLNTAPSPPRPRPRPRLDRPSTASPAPTPTNSSDTNYTTEAPPTRQHRPAYRSSSNIASTFFYNLLIY